MSSLPTETKHKSYRVGFGVMLIRSGKQQVSCSLCRSGIRRNIARLAEAAFIRTPAAADRWLRGAQ